MVLEKFNFISPLDYRYFDEKAAKFLSGGARTKYQLVVELALVRVFSKRGFCSQRVVNEVEKAIEDIDPEEVLIEEEQVTKHDIRALVNCIRKRVSDEAKPFIHLGATSCDIIDTANALYYKKAIEEVVLPSLLNVEKTLIDLALREKATLQIGRTHGQHAEPITFGFAMTEYVSRLGNRINEIVNKKDKLVGKFSGPVGAYNAISLLVDDPLGFEKELMESLGLKASPSSTQIVEAEPITDLVHSLVSTFGVIANIADDMRNLQRSEIGEVGEMFEAKQVGSSTMPHKRNPWNFEHVKSFYKEFMPRMFTVYLDQISEHQRDLTNSASQRFIPEIFVGLVLGADRLNKYLAKLVVDKANMAKNFDQNKKMLVAEPLYILLAFHGNSDAHEVVRQLTLEAQKTGKPLMELAMKNQSLKPFIGKFSGEQLKILNEPEKYIGKAIEKTELICERWKKELA